MYFGRFAWVSLLANSLIIPVQAPLLLSGLFGTALGLLYPPLGTVLLRVSWLFLEWTVQVVEAMAALPWAESEIAVPPLLLYGFLMLLGGFTLYRGTRPTLDAALGGAGTAASHGLGTDRGFAGGCRAAVHGHPPAA
ncbi:MAG: hypothetical protein HC915_15975 [Anaerolineae bacterium]|nr:hypothetical protein [Anaerolineae bacterium]